MVADVFILFTLELAHQGGNGLLSELDQGVTRFVPYQGALQSRDQERNGLFVMDAGNRPNGLFHAGQILFVPVILTSRGSIFIIARLQLAHQSKQHGEDPPVADSPDRFDDANLQTGFLDDPQEGIDCGLVADKPERPNGLLAHGRIGIVPHKTHQGLDRRRGFQDTQRFRGSQADPPILILQRRHQRLHRRLTNGHQRRNGFIADGRHLILEQEHQGLHGPRVFESPHGAGGMHAHDPILVQERGLQGFEYPLIGNLGQNGRRSFLHGQIRVLQAVTQIHDRRASDRRQRAGGGSFHGSIGIP